MALFLELYVGETLDLGGGEIRLTLEEKSGRKARLRIEAREHDVKLERGEPFAPMPVMARLERR
jgi:hypothetical protein